MRFHCNSEKSEEARLEISLNSTDTGSLRSGKRAVMCRAFRHLYQLLTTHNPRRERLNESFFSQKAK